jgi:hypothetical protein
MHQAAGIGHRRLKPKFKTPIADADVNPTKQSLRFRKQQTSDSFTRSSLATSVPIRLIRVALPVWRIRNSPCVDGG